MFKRFKNIKLKYLLTHIIVTLAYPAVRAYRAQSNGLLLFTDALTIIGALLIILGIFYSFILHGDFDRVSYTFQRGLIRNGIVRPFEDVQRDKQKDREDSFNYPLWLGILYIIVSSILAYTVL